VCEGRDDEQFLFRMLDHLHIRDVDIRRYDGKLRLPTLLLGLRDSTDFESVRALGVLRDADDHAGNAFRSVADRLRRLDLPSPRQAAQLSTGRCGIDGVVRTVGVFILPGDDRSGELEDLCLQAIAGDAALDCAQEFLDCVQLRTGTACLDSDRSKARLNAWLSSRRNPSLRIGTAMATRDLPADSPAFDSIKRFLTDLAAAAGQPPAPSA
jgi:hypothetical protein